MSQLLIRGLDEKAIQRLKERAKSHGRSLESEARSILESAAGYSAAEARAAVEGWQKRLAGRNFGDSADFVRKDRRR